MPMPTPTPISAAPAAGENFQDLARAIAERDLPAFGLTLRELFEATQNEGTSGQQIADIVLRDPALTSRVLRAANAAHLGLAGPARVVTVSRAVIVLGVNPIRSLCVSALTVEVMAAGTRQARRVQLALGRALHAAVQARDMGLRRQAGKAAAEQLFVEALLAGVGELAFWCFGGAHAEALDQALDRGQDAQLAQTAILGTTLRAFGRELLRAWNLEGLLRDSPEVALAHRLGDAATGGGATAANWNDAGVGEATRAIARLLGQTEPATVERLQANAEQAMELARALGALDAAAGIPAPRGEPAAPEPAAANEFGEPDARQQLRVLTEMGQVARSRKELPLLLQTCLEGLHRTVGLDRCALCLLNPARSRLAARLAIGPGSAVLRQSLQWDWSAELEGGADAAQWCRGPARPPAAWLLRAAAASEAFVAPLCVDGQWLGLFYADRKPSGRALSAEQFESFQSFISLVQVIARSLPRG